MMLVFNGLSADEVWKRLAQEFQRPDGSRSQNSQNGMTKEILHVAISISDPLQRWVTSRQPAINPAFALAEVVWIINGRHDLAFLEFWNKKLRNYVGPGPELHGAYGYRLRRRFGLDQLMRAYQALKHKPETRQVVLQIWDSGVDMPKPDGTPVSKDIPCNVMSILKVRDKKLEWLQIIRSNDMFFGVPYNLVQFTSLQEIIAGWLGIKCGTYNQISDSLHVYERNEKDIRESSTSTTLSAPNTDSLALPLEESKLTWRELEKRAEQMIDSALEESVLRKISQWKDAPQAYKNILFVLSAEAARRHKWKDTSNELITECTNPAMKELWIRWLQQLT